MTSDKVRSTGERCCCGEPLHYKNPAVQQYVERMIAAYGSAMRVQLQDHTEAYMVPRHYVALHGLKASALAALAQQYGWARHQRPRWDWKP